MESSFFTQSKNLAVLKSLRQSNSTTPDVLYNFNFVSLIAPKFVKSLSITDLHTHDNRPNQHVDTKSKLFLKQSYLLLTWLYYLSFASVRGADEKLIRFSFLPSKKKHYTLTKAPMAHKTNSKEQFLFKFYHLRISFKASINWHASQTRASTDLALAALYVFKQSFPSFETNSLFLKSSTFHIRFSLKHYLTTFTTKTKQLR